MNDRDLIVLARAWPADPIDRTIIHDLADALEAHVEETPGVGPTDPETSGENA